MKTTEDILNERSKTHGDFIQGSVTFNALMELINNNRNNIDGVQYYALTMIAGKIVRILMVIRTKLTTGAILSVTQR